MAVLSLARKQAPTVLLLQSVGAVLFPVWAGSKVGRPLKSRGCHSPMWQATYYHKTHSLPRKHFRGAGGGGAERVFRESIGDHTAEMISIGVLCRNNL